MSSPKYRGELPSSQRPTTERDIDDGIGAHEDWQATSGAVRTVTHSGSAASSHMPRQRVLWASRQGELLEEPPEPDEPPPELAEPLEPAEDPLPEEPSPPEPELSVQSGGGQSEAET